MNLDIRRKRDGICSLIWVYPGFVAFEFADIAWPGSAGSGVLAFLVIFCAWWGAGLVLAISGLRSRARISVLASAGTILCFLFFLLGVVPLVEARG
jgi:hypothetical protein